MSICPSPSIAPAPDALLEEVLQGLRQRQKTLPCKLFYDKRGSQIFDQICEQPEYYPTRTESLIMRTYAQEMADSIGQKARLVEYGSGSSLKTRILLDNLPTVAEYIPIDISREHLLASAEQISRDYPSLSVTPLCADYTSAFALPPRRRGVGPTTIYFPGSTIGNFHPSEADCFLQNMAQAGGPGCGLLIGVDLRKSAHILEPAYNDRAGATREFNLNALERLNREFGADFDRRKWEHYAFYNDAMGRIEMHLVCLADHEISIAGELIQFETDETIWTECSYKYALEDFQALAGLSGWRIQSTWTDPRSLFSVQRFQLASDA